MSELLVLDPGEVSENRTEFDLTPFVGSAGPDFGDAAVQQAVADAGLFGQVPIDISQIPNRTITIPLALQERAGLQFHDVRIALQHKAALFMEQHGWLKRSTSSGDVFTEVTNAQLKLGGSTMQAIQDVDTDAQLVLTTLPVWLGPEQTLETIPSGTGEIDFLTYEVINGNLPGRVRIIVSNLSGDDQRGLIWAVRSRNLIDLSFGGVAPTNKLSYEAEDLTPVGSASSQVLSGSSGGSVIKYSNVPATTDEWNPTWHEIVSTKLSGGQDLTHVGSHRIWTRAYIEGGTAEQLSTTRLRFRAEVGDLTLGASGNPTGILKYGDFYVLDLGVFRFDKAPVGNHRWQGYVEAMNMNGTDDVSIDKLWVIPVAEGTGALRALNPPPYQYDGKNIYDAVMYANGTAELRSDGFWRLSQSGVGYGPIQRPQGPLPQIPASGMERAPLEFFVKISQGTLDELNADSGLNDFGMEIKYQPSYLFVS